MTELSKIYENFNSFLTEDIYSSEMRNFIRLARKIEQKPLPAQLVILHKFMRDSSFTPAGYGAFRYVYKSTSNEIVKIANDTGSDGAAIEAAKMNKWEIENFNNSNIEVFPRVEEFDKRNFLWFVVEKLEILDGPKEPVFKRLFPKLWEISKDAGAEWMDFAHVSTLAGIYSSYLDPPENTKEKPRARQEHRPGLSQQILKWFGAARPKRGGSHGGDTRVQNEKHKEFMIKILDYFQNGDDNWRRVKQAIKHTNMDTLDLHAGNWGYTGDVIKILDAAGYGD